MAERSDRQTPPPEPEEVDLGTTEDASALGDDTAVDQADAPAEEPHGAQETATASAEKPAEQARPGPTETRDLPTPQSESDRLIIELNRAHNDNLFQAFEKSQTMLAFAVDQGIELKPQIVTPVNAAIRAYSHRRWTPEIEDNFFSAYSRLSQELGDVSSETIEWSKTNGSRTTLWMAVFGGLMLLLLIFIQYRVIYLYDSSTNYQQTRDALIEREAEFAALQISLSALYNQDTENLSAEERAALTHQETELTSKQFTLQEQSQRLRNRLQAQYAILSEWVSNIESDPPPNEPGWLASAEEIAAYEEKFALWRAQKEQLEPHEQEYGVQQAISQLRLLNDYILPAIYGALGTIAFILRQISIRLQAQSLRLSTIMNYLVRLPLGALSGIAVGLLLRPEDTPEGIAALQPLALAFVAGYSVELVFAAMDKLVIAFAGEKRT